MSCISSSRTATPFAHAAHSGLTSLLDGTPKTEAPRLFGRASAMSRADTMACRLADAIATEALSMIRLTIIAATSLVTATLSAATPAIFQASWSSRFRPAFDGLTLTS